MNLMCPARLILLSAGAAADAADASGALAGERIAMVYAGPPAAEPASSLANELGVGVTAVPELLAAAGESGPDAVRRSNAALSGIADLHRGETVVVLTEGLSLGFELPGGPIELEHDGEAWTVLPDPNEVTLAAYEQAADRYRATIGHGPNPLLDLVSTGLHAGASVLELGSGTGEDALELEARGFRVRRTDAVEAFVEMMRADGRRADRLNALTDEFGGPYDLVFADAVFLHFSPEQLATVLRKAAQAAGHLAFTLREGVGSEWSNRYLELPRHFVLWEEPALRQLLTESGWTVLRWDRGETKIGGWFFVLARRTTDENPAV